MAATKAAQSKAVTKKGEGNVALAEDYAKFDGQGYEDQSSDDIIIPFLSVLQGLSPQVDKKDGIPGAQPGMLFNTVSNEVYDPDDDPVFFVPAWTQQIYVEWTPRDKGGGMVGRHEVDSDIVRWARSNHDFGQYKTRDGNDLVDTFYVYGVQCNADGDIVGPLVLAFAKTKIAVYKRWNTRVKMFQVQTSDGRKITPPLFAHLVKITTRKDKNKRGQEYYNFVLEPANGSVKDSLLKPNDERFRQAQEWGDMAKTGVAKAAVESADQRQDEVGGGGADPESQVPF